MRTSHHHNHSAPDRANSRVNRNGLARGALLLAACAAVAIVAAEWWLVRPGTVAPADPTLGVSFEGSTPHGEGAGALQQPFERHGSTVAEGSAPASDGRAVPPRILELLELSGEPVSAYWEQQAALIEEGRVQRGTKYDDFFHLWSIGTEPDVLVSQLIRPNAPEGSKWDAAKTERARQALDDFIQEHAAIYAAAQGRAGLNERVPAEPTFALQTRRSKQRSQMIRDLEPRLTALLDHYENRLARELGPPTSGKYLAP